MNGGRGYLGKEATASVIDRSINIIMMKLAFITICAIMPMFTVPKVRVD